MEASDHMILQSSLDFHRLTASSLDSLHTTLLKTTKTRHTLHHHHHSIWNHTESSVESLTGPSDSFLPRDFWSPSQSVQFLGYHGIAELRHGSGDEEQEPQLVMKDH